MSRLRLWQVTNDRPVVLDRRADFLEKHLESWIETTPSMVAEDMEWVARQMHLPDGSILDLLGVTPEGQWVVAELKQGPVGVSTLAQVLHYGLYIGSISGEELVRRLNSVSEERRTELHEQVAAETDESPRQLQLLLVGTNSDVDLTDAVEFLGKRGLDIPVRVVTFTPFVNHAGDQFLARHVEDTHEPEESRPARAARVEWVLERAERFGRRDLVEEFIEVGRRFGLGVRPWPKSITLTGSRGRTLVYIQPLPDGVEVAEAPETLMDIFSVSEEDMTAFFGPLKDRWRTRTTGEAKAFLAQFEAFMLAHSETSGMSSEPTDKLS